jgi:hypothetical protein
MERVYYYDTGHMDDYLDLYNIYLLMGRPRACVMNEDVMDAVAGVLV